MAYNRAQGPICDRIKEKLNNNLTIMAFIAGIWVSLRSKNEPLRLNPYIYYKPTQVKSANANCTLNDSRAS